MHERGSIEKLMDECLATMSAKTKALVVVVRWKNELDPKSCRMPDNEAPTLRISC